MNEDTLFKASELHHEIDSLKRSINEIENDRGMTLKFYCPLPNLSPNGYIDKNNHNDIYYFVKKTLLTKLENQLEQKQKEFKEL